MKNSRTRTGLDLHDGLARVAALGILTVGPMLSCGAEDVESEDSATSESGLWGGSHSGPRKPICDDGDAELAYNAMPYGVVDCQNPSVGFQATSTREFGGEVSLAGQARRLVSLKVLFASFACQTGAWNTGDCQTNQGARFSHPITANMYSVTDCPLTSGDPCPGPLLASVTVDQMIPYRPSANTTGKCIGASAGKWWNPAASACQNQISTVLTFPFPASPRLPDQVIWTVAFNTTTHGAVPIGPRACSITNAGCPYDSLNVGAKTYSVSPFAGTDFDTSGVYHSSSSPSSYCDNGTGGVGTLRLDMSCWRVNRPLGAITTKK